MLTKCIFYSEFGGLQDADSRINFCPTGQKITPGIRYKTYTNRYEKEINRK